MTSVQTEVTMSNKNIKDTFKEYALKNHESELLKILRSEDKMQHYSLVINFVVLFESCAVIGDALLANPERNLEICDLALGDAQAQIFIGQPEDVQRLLAIKSKVHTRFTGLPSCPELHRTLFPKNEDLGSFLTITGTVVRTCSPKMLEYQRIFKCRKCKYENLVKAEYELNYSITAPRGCRNPEGCQGTNFALVQCTDGLNFKDFQEIKVQEQVSKLSVGTMPRSMLVTLEDDLVDACKPGDDIIICGTVLRRWKNLGSNKRSDVELVLRANHMQVCNDQQAAILVTKETHDLATQFWIDYAAEPLKGRDAILASFCPHVFGLYVVKLAMAMVVSGGVAQQRGGTRVRGESHLMLVGDPGTAKSHLLRFAARLSPRSVLTTGIGSTAAGLTVTALMEAGGEWQLEAGALVLADGGVCCIDEFSSIREHDRASIHEAMEQQTISVAKAGMVCKLNTRCTVLAATNPKGKYDPNECLSVNIAVASPLLSRFDLVLVLLDSSNEEWDKVVSSYILKGKQPGIEQGASDMWDLQRMQSYFCLIKRLQPKLGPSANRILGQYYQAQRQSDDRNAARTTVRLLESLIRLSQAHARLMFREEVTTMDAVVAVSLVEASMQGSTLLPGTNIYHSSFPKDPMENYREQATTVLERLGLEKEFEEEMVWLDSLRNQRTSQKRRVPEAPGSPAHTQGGQDRLNHVLTNIRRNKDRAALQAANLQRISPIIRRTEPEPGPSGINKPSKKPALSRIIPPSSSSSEDSDTESLNFIKQIHKNKVSAGKSSGQNINTNVEDTNDGTSTSDIAGKQKSNSESPKPCGSKILQNKNNKVLPDSCESSKHNTGSYKTQKSSKNTTNRKRIIESDSDNAPEVPENEDFVESHIKGFLNKFAFNKKPAKKIHTDINESDNLSLKENIVISNSFELESPKTTTSPINVKSPSQEFASPNPITSPVINNAITTPSTSSPEVTSRKLSASTLEKLQRFSCPKSSDSSSPNSPTVKNMDKDEVKEKRLENFVKRKQQLSQLSSQNSQSPLLTGSNHPFLACDDDDEDLDLSF